MQNNSDEIATPQMPSAPLSEAPVFDVLTNDLANLRKAREAKQLSMGDVAYSLKVSPRVIEALEAGAWDKLPGRTFVVGILRAYGRLLDVSVDSLVDSVPGAPAAMKKAVTSSSATPRPAAPKSVRDGETKKQTNKMFKSGLVMIVIALVMAYAVPREAMESALQEAQSMIQHLMDGKAQETAVTAGPEQAQPVTTAEQGGSVSASNDQQAQTGTGTLELRFSAPAWVEVRDHTGRIIYSQLNAAGTTQFITGAAPLDVMIGNAKQVQARWRDEPLKLDKLSGDDVARQTLR